MELTLAEARMLKRLVEEGREAKDDYAWRDRGLAKRVLGKVDREVTELEAADRLGEAQMELRLQLHRLWLEAGEPSTRQMSRQIVIDGKAKSNMTWHYALRCNPVPSLRTLRALVTYLEGDLGRFEELWLRAKGMERSAPIPAHLDD